MWTFLTPSRFPVVAALVLATACGGGDPAPDPDPDPSTIDNDGDGFTADVDCDDNDASVYPGAPEICDGKDNSCNDLVDDEDPDVVGQLSWFPDEDGDGYGDELADATLACFAPEGMVNDDTDCDDADRVVHPGRFDFADLKDNDCDGEFDEDVGTEEYRHDTDIQPIWGSSCSGCHIGGSSGGLSLASSAWPRIFQVGSSVRGLDYITPGDHQGSYLWHKLKGAHADVGGSGGRMPPSGALPDRTLDIIDTWIWEGAVR